MTGCNHRMKWLSTQNLSGFECFNDLYHAWAGRWALVWAPPWGEVEKVDTNEEGIGWSKFLRVQIRINIMKLLARGWMLKLRD
jgi:hypothetical protein